MSEIRKTAILSLQDIIEKKIFFNDIKEGYSTFTTQDIAFLNMLILTSLRHLVSLRKIIKRFSAKKLPNKYSFVEYALILAICEILYLRTPEYAIINSYVEIIKKNNNKFLAGFANAVLRKVCGIKEELLNEENEQILGDEFIKILKQDYDAETIAKIEKSLAKEPPLDISVKEDAEKWADALNGSIMPNGSIRISNKSDIENLEGFDEGKWWVQDIAASLAVITMENIKDKRVLDLCSAPGGKTAQLINKGAIVYSLDVSEQRIQTLKKNLNRLRYNAEDIICADGIEFLQNFKDEKFDAILLDAPCSATGTMRRHPEILHIKTLEDIKKQSQLQTAFLEHISNALKVGGTLIYCTCSISKLEGERQIKTFIKNNPSFKIVQIKEKEISLYHNVDIDYDIITKEGFIRTLPYHLDNMGGMDSFFIAKLQKVE